MKKTTTPKSDILEQLFEKGFATKEIEILPGKLSAVIKTISASDQLSLEKEMQKEDNASYAYIVHSYSIKLLSKIIVKYGEKEFSDSKSCFEFLMSDNISSIILNKIIKEHQKFEKEVMSSLNIEEVQKTFFDQGPQETGPEQLPKESISGKKKVFEKK